MMGARPPTRRIPATSAGEPIPQSSRLQAVIRVVILLMATLFAWKMARITWLHMAGPSGDFLFFWDAARHVLRGDAAGVYVAHATPRVRLDPLGYPPPLLLLVAPLGLLPYGPALVVWLGVTAFLCLLAARQPLRLLLLVPPAGYNVLSGQNGFLTSAMLLGGANCVDRRPMIAGAILGLLVVKPHLAVLIPVALAAGRRWTSFTAAAGSAATFAGVAAVAFGPAIYQAWSASVAQYGPWLIGGAWKWNLLASLYGLLRWCGANHMMALTAHVLVAVLAAVVAFKAWRENWDSRVAVLAAATVLVPPYFFTYDAVILIAPLAWLAARDGWRALIVWVLLLVALLGTTFLRSSLLPLGSVALPNTTSLAAMLSLLFLWSERRQP